MIKVNRPKHPLDYDKVYMVYVDNRFVMQLENGEIKDYHTKTGKHTIQVKSDIYVSNMIEFDMGDGEILEFLVKPDYENNWFSKFLHKTIYGKMGLKIELSKDFYI